MPVVAEGVLDMVDFKQRIRKCRITPPTGAPILCTFEKDLDNDIHELLRKSVTISGHAKLQPADDQIKLIHILSISAIRQDRETDDNSELKAPALGVGSGDFFANHTIEDLARQQKIKPIDDLSVLAGGISEEVDLDEFLGDIYACRR